MDYLKLLKEGLKNVKKKVPEKKRFKIPELDIYVFGNKTVLRNFAQITSLMRREPKHLARYLFKELATPGNIQSNHLIFNSRVSKDSLKKKIQSYLKEFVYCKTCNSPDTKIIKENRLLFMVCEACGARSPIRKI